MNPESELVRARAVFATTHWSVVVAVGQTDSAKGSEAMAELCRTYWYPLYAYVRRKGHDAHDAQDLTQEFFSRLLARNYLSVADGNKGKFRSFLLGSLEHFLAREWTKAHVQKRGGGQAIFSLDALNAENRYLHEPADQLTAEKIFDRHRATTLLDQGMTRLAAECLGSHKSDLFAKVKELLSCWEAFTLIELLVVIVIIAPATAMPLTVCLASPRLPPVFTKAWARRA